MWAEARGLAAALVVGPLGRLKPLQQPRKACLRRLHAWMGALRPVRPVRAHRGLKPRLELREGG